VVRLAPLDRKLARDLWRMRGHVVAVAIVAACGTATLVTMHGTYDALVASRAAIYERQRFAEVFASAKRAPLPVLERIAAIPGVAVVEDRVVHEVTLDVPGLAEPATGRLVSIPDTARDTLNAIRLRSGRTVRANAPDEVVASEAFAKANGLRPGTELAAVINGRWQRLQVVGIAVSPEYVYEQRGVSAFPDNRRFGVLWMGRTALEAALDMKGAFNDVAVRLAPGFGAEAVIAGMDRLLEPYGGLGAYDREQQLSHQFLRDEIAQDRVTGTLIPAIFFAVTAFLIHNVLARLIALQRPQVGLLKAFGYGTGAVTWHFVKFALVAVIVGSALGVALGVWLGDGLAAVYREFFHLPDLEFVLRAETLAWVALLAVATAALGAWPAVRHAARMPPAEAMRPEAPALFRPLLLERLGWSAVVPTMLRMVLRNLERRPVKAALSALAIGLATALLVVGQYSFDAIDEIIRIQFRHAQRDDVAVDFIEPRGAQAANELASLPGVLRVEPYRAALVRLRFGHRDRRAAILGIAPGASLRRPLDSKMREIGIPPEGIVLNDKLARVLGIRAGDALTVEVLEGRRNVRRIIVAGTVDEFLGMSAYMDARALADLLGEGPTLSGAYLAIDPARQADLFVKLKQMPAVAAVTLREATLRSFLDTVARNITLSTTVLIAFACAIAAGMVYNGARIALSEHAIEFASLRILGFTQREVGTMLLAEQGILAALGIPLGFAIGFGLCAWLVQVFDTEMYRMPLVLRDTTFAFAGAIVVVAAAVSGALVLYRLRRTDLVEVLKTRE
jgi:putative ABC transport system permease protein